MIAVVGTPRAAPLRRLVGMSAVVTAAAVAGGAPDPSRWHGFNLLEKFTARNQRPFVEDDFRWICELGFNFVRLPMDYRCYAPDILSTNFREEVLREIDQAVDYGRRHGVHVCINLHRAPGFCINPPAEPRDLWTDPEVQAAFVAHWTMFARRYRGIPGSELSFNLLNEPARCTREAYLKVHLAAIDAIHAIDPDRPVMVDGHEAGRAPLEEFLARPNVILATRGYHPGTVSHYRAGWVKGSDQWPTPAWPMLGIVGYLYGPTKKEYQSPLVLEGSFPAGAEVWLDLRRMSGSMTLAAEADGVEIARRAIRPAAETNDWHRDPSEPRWPIHASPSGVVWRVRLERPASRIALRAVEGDWAIFREIGLWWPGDPPRAFGADPRWGATQAVWRVSAEGHILPQPGVEPDAPLREYLKPWLDYRARGGRIFVGEFGCYNKTPHEVALAWLGDWLRLWHREGIGWAMWNFRGTFGILDSGRADVRYEEWRGHRLDRRMLELLQRHLPGRLASP